MLENFTGGNRIDVHDCTLLTNKCLVHLKDFQVVTLYGYTGITEGGIANFKLKSPGIIFTRLKFTSIGTTIVRINYIKELLYDANHIKIENPQGDILTLQRYLRAHDLARQHRADLLYIKTILETPQQRKLNDKQRGFQQVKKTKQPTVQKRKHCSH